MDYIEKIKIEGFRRRLSPRTIKAYCYWVEKFQKFNKKDFAEISKKDIREYIEHLSKKNAAGKTLNVVLCALTFLIDVALNKKWKLNIKYSKTPKKLPEYLTKEETKRLIFSINNEKHKLIICLLYSTGLRVSELVNLRVRDFIFENGVGWVRGGKGNKDRQFIIAEKLREEIIHFFDDDYLTADSYVFKGQNGAHLSTRTVQEIVKKAAMKAGIEKNVHPHTLRHSFATHCAENGMSVFSLQSLLGHNGPETSFDYIHRVAPKFNEKSPYDTLVN